MVFIPFLVFSANLTGNLFKEVSKCKEVFFTQKTIFEGDIETYKGVLKIANRQKEIVYFTDPPFVVIQKGKILKMGYEGEDFQTFDADSYPNPVLAILLHFNNLNKVFEIKNCTAKRCILIPKNSLKEYLEKVEVFFSNGRVEKIRAEGGDFGTVEIQILELKGCFNS